MSTDLTQGLNSSELLAVAESLKADGVTYETMRRAEWRRLYDEKVKEWKRAKDAALATHADFIARMQRLGVEFAGVDIKPGALSFRLHELDVDFDILYRNCHAGDEQCVEIIADAAFRAGRRTAAKEIVDGIAGRYDMDLYD